MIDWQDTTGRVAHDTVITMQGSDKKTRSADMIVRSAEPGRVPLLRVEHLGLSGRMEILSLQAVAVRERGWVWWASGGLLGLWGLWCYGFARSLTKSTRPRVAGVAVILVAMGWFLIVPGPWAHSEPLVGDFQTGEKPVAETFVNVSGAGGQDVEPLAKMPTQGTWLMKVKKALSFLRPVLHALLFAAPAFVIALLCGARCAWWCGVLASCMVELGQIGFGFGFDWVDGIDLLVNAAGIAAAVWVWKRYGRWGEGRLEIG